jgi:acetolactate synthase-1/2/3 large subunit
VRGIAEATGASFLEMKNNADIVPVLEEALKVSSQRRPVLVDVNIDYSKQTRFTKGILKTNFERMPAGMKLRMAGRALWRRVNPPAEESCTT